MQATPAERMLRDRTADHLQTSPKPYAGRNLGLSPGLTTSQSVNHAGSLALIWRPCRFWSLRLSDAAVSMFKLPGFASLSTAWMYSCTSLHTRAFQTVSYKVHNFCPRVTVIHIEQKYWPLRSACERSPTPGPRVPGLDSQSQLRRRRLQLKHEHTRGRRGREEVPEGPSCGTGPSNFEARAFPWQAQGGEGSGEPSDLREKK